MNWIKTFVNDIKRGQGYAIASIIFLFTITALLTLGFIKQSYTSTHLQEERQRASNVIELEHHGETHEYVIYYINRGGGITHLPNCKYCKENVK